MYFYISQHLRKLIKISIYIIYCWKQYGQPTPTNSHKTNFQIIFSLLWPVNQNAVVVSILLTRYALTIF